MKDTTSSSSLSFDTMSLISLSKLLLLFSLALSLFSSSKENSLLAVVEACSDVLVTPGASSKGDAMIGYIADDPALYGVLYHYPPTTNNNEDDKVDVYDWDTGVS